MTRRIGHPARLALATGLLALLGIFGTAGLAAAGDAPPEFDDYVLPDGSFDETGYTAALNAYLSRQAGSTVSGSEVSPGVATTGSLPRTGNEVGYGIAIGVGFLVVGGGLVLAARRERQNHAPADRAGAT
jgi:LPXTG-motif cell wall-anchored protein